MASDAASEDSPYIYSPEKSIPSGFTLEKRLSDMHRSNVLLALDRMVSHGLV